MVFKYLLPFDRFVIRSPLLPAESSQALQNAVEPKKYLRFSNKGEKDFEGKVDSESFRISRLISYRNSFLPVVLGHIELAPGGCTIYIHMRPIIAVLIFGFFWLTSVVYIGLTMLEQLPSVELNANPRMLVPVEMLIFFMLLANGGFWFEAVKQKKMLLEIFGSKDA